MKKAIMPQEIEVWYLIPALRRELTKTLMRDHNLSQRRIAEMMGLSEPAISQYLTSKRGSDIKFTNEEKQEIKRAANNIVNKNENLVKTLYGLCVKFRGSKTMCEIHKQHDPTLPHNCDFCVE